MPVPQDDSSELQQYAHPERLVTTQWLAANLDNPDVVVVESDEDVTKREPTDYPVVDRNDDPIRAFRDDVNSHIGQGPLIDVRSPQEYSGELLHMPAYPQEGALRGGHIPTAKSKPWKMAANDDG